MEFARHLALHLSDHRWFRPAVMARALAEPIARMIEIGFEPCPALDPRRDPSIGWLKQMQKALPGKTRHPPHDVIDIVRQMVREGEPYAAEVPLRSVVGLTASKGELQMSLDSLPETMRLAADESFGPFDEEQMRRLRNAVMNEFSSSSREGVFHLDLQEWDGAYVAANSGASRRFALWRRLSTREPEPIRIRALVSPYALNADALRVLRERCRLIYCYENSLAEPFMTAEELLPNSFAYLGGFSLTPPSMGLFLVPYIHRLPPRLFGIMSRLHRAIDEAGVLDVGRFLAEQISVARRRVAHSITNRDDKMP